MGLGDRAAPDKASDPDEPLDEQLLVEWICRNGKPLPGLLGYPAAQWPDIVNGFPEHHPEAVEEAINRALDRGMVYEPILGTIAVL